MEKRPITRRGALAGGAGMLAVLAGCLDSLTGGPSVDGVPIDADGGDGLALSPDESVDLSHIDPSEFETTEQDGVEVPLAPIEITHDWYRAGEARFVDARGGGQYESVRIEGAVLSPAPDGGDPDPISDWDTDELIVTYCDCPHHLAAARAAALIDDGYENVYVIDEGFVPWRENGYAVAGENVDEVESLWTVNGVTDTSLAGNLVWGMHEETDQQEAVPIADDGTFEMTIRFTGVTDETPLTLETSTTRVERPLGELSRETVQLY